MTDPHRNQLRKILAELAELENRLNFTPPAPDPNPPTALVPTRPSPLARQGEALLALREIQRITDKTNQRSGPLRRQIKLPSLKSITNRLLPTLGDFRSLQRFWKIITGLRYQKTETVKLANGERMCKVQHGPSWVSLLVLLEKGETLDTLEIVYEIFQHHTELTIDWLLRIFHQYCQNNSQIFLDFFEIINDKYLQIRGLARASFIASLLHEIDRDYHGDLEGWLIAATKPDVDTAFDRARRASNLPPNKRLLAEFARDQDSENLRLRQTLDRTFNPDHNGYKGERLA